jgi:hypothetical protein
MKKVATTSILAFSLAVGVCQQWRLGKRLYKWL